MNLVDPETISISRRWGDEPGIEEELGSAEGGFDEVDAKLVAADVAALVSVRQLAVLREFQARARSREEVAMVLGISHGTVSNELRRVGALLLDVADGDRAVARRALDYLAGEAHF